MAQSGSDEPRGAVSWQATEAAGKRFAALFQGSALSWQLVGHVRRRKDGPMHLLHLVVPRAADDQGYANAVWGRAVELLVKQTVRLWPYAGGPRGPEWESTLAGFELGGWHHEISLCHPDHYGPRLAELTGPPGYWRMLLFRLRLAGTLQMHRGAVCAIDRSGPSERLAPIPCPLEETFFKLARTRYQHRFERPADAGGDNTNDWKRGVLGEWYPPGVLPYADPARHPELFDASRIVPPRYVGRERERWLHL